MVEWLERRDCDQHNLGQSLLAPFCFLAKTFYGTFPCLVILPSSSKFQSYFYKTKKQNKKFQPSSNILASPEAGRGIACPLY